MEREKILKETKNLPTMMGGQIAEDWQIWEENDAEAKFMVTKEILPVPNAPTVYMLSVSGPAEVKERLIADFISAFGEPMNRFNIPEAPGIDYVSWNAKKVDNGRN